MDGYQFGLYAGKMSIHQLINVSSTNCKYL